MRRDLILGWQMNPHSGWGVLGINLFSQLADNPDFRPICRGPIDYGMFLGIDPLRLSKLVQACDESNKATDYSGILIDPVGNNLEGHYEADCLVGRVIIENADLTGAQGKLAKFDALLTGSTWNKQLLEDATGRHVEMILEGVDETLFFPGPRPASENFYIYSCGKLEPRKAQDLVLLAFKAFSQRHPEARLLTLWQSPWNDIGNGYKGLCEAPCWMDEHGKLAIRQWAHDNGVHAGKVLDLGSVPNFVLPNLLRQCDVMLAPTRVESCTSLPVKEAMACGVPVIGARHTGMLDIPEGMMWDLKQFTDMAMPHWKEPDLEEIIESLEWLYQRPQERRSVGLAASEWVRQERPWSRHSEALTAWIKTLS